MGIAYEYIYIYAPEYISVTNEYMYMYAPEYIFFSLP